jgi:formate hydrogenlyase subunit 6/NADH:ubiquinone oxidoreductase subunit I
MKKPGAMLGEVLAHVLKKPATTHYPFVAAHMPVNFRGKLISYDSKCVGCKLCMKDCPSHAITITKVAEKRFEVTIDLDRCIYCGQCVDSCNKKALQVTQEFELASLDRSTLRVRIGVEPKATAEAAAVVDVKPTADGANAETAAGAS